MENPSRHFSDKINWREIFSARPSILLAVPPKLVEERDPHMRGIAEPVNEDERVFPRSGFQIVNLKGPQVRRPGLIRVGLIRHCHTNYKRQDYAPGALFSIYRIYWSTYLVSVGRTVPVTDGFGYA